MVNGWKAGVQPFCAWIMKACCVPSVYVLETAAFLISGTYTVLQYLSLDKEEVLVYIGLDFFFGMWPSISFDPLMI